MTTNTQAIVEEPLPSVDPDCVELQSIDDSVATLSAMANGMGLFYSYGCGTECSMISTHGDFRTALSGSSRF